MRVLKWLVIVVVVLAAGVVGVGFLLPDTAHVERSVVINARPSTVYVALNGFRQFDKWSPWAGLDPQAEYLVEGPPLGVGAKQSWRSQDPSVGAGSQEIIEAVAHEKIVVRLIFEGWDSDNLTTYTLAPEGRGTRLVWSYDATFGGNLMARYFGLMMDGMIGADYEKGLASLKALVETLPQVDLSGLEAEVTTVDSRPMLFISGAAPADEAGGMLAAAFERIAAHMAQNGLAQAEPPIAITRQYDEETRLWRFDAAMIADRPDPPASPEAGIQSGMTYGGLVIRAAHRGPPSAMEPTYEQLVAFRTVAGFEDNGDSWEQYIAGDGGSDGIVYIYWPIR